MEYIKLNRKKMIDLDKIVSNSWDFRNFNDNILIKGDCFDIFKFIEDNSVNAIIADLPYGRTNCKWDSVLPLNEHVLLKNRYLERDEYYLLNFNCGLSKNEIDILWNTNKQHGLWYHYKRILKNNGIIVLFAQTPFDKVLGCSNLEWLKYEWIWEKTQATGYFNAKKMPMNAHENILVFYKNKPTYNPQKTEGHKPVNTYTKSVEVSNKTQIYGKVKKDISGGGKTDRYPRTVQVFASDKQKNKLNGTIHPTQKPLALLEYLVKTYTNEGDLILDNTMGSGTTNLASLKLNRRSIGIEKEEVWYNVAVKRCYEFYNK
jgi:site-specific DNA-methyltransferase (adenine-specific)